MKRHAKKIFMIFSVVMLLVVLLSVNCFADTTSYLEHYDPNGTISSFYVYNSSECNRTINVKMVDLDGNVLKQVTIKTKYGENNTFHLSLGGYDIVNFSSNQGLWETCKLKWTSGSGYGIDCDLFVDYYFRTALSQKTLNITVEMRKWDPITLKVNHYVQRTPGYKDWRDNFDYHSTTDTQTIDYLGYFNVSSKNITGYTLNANYKSSVYGSLCFESLIGSCKNMPESPRGLTYDLHQTGWDDGMESWSTYTESKDGRIDWCDNRVFVVEFFYDIKEYTVSFDANGGTGAPGSVTKYHGYDIALPETVPTRTGYTFKGWGTYSTDTTPNYQPGGSYTSNSTRTLYAIWEANPPAYYVVKYNANGGIGAPADQIKYHDVPLVLTSEIPTRSGYTFAGWGTNAYATVVSYNPGDTYTANASITLYAIWNENGGIDGDGGDGDMDGEIGVDWFVVDYDANRGDNSPDYQFKYPDVDIILRSEIPTREGYTFLGWAEYDNADYPTYYAGGTYCANASVVLYAVWEMDVPPVYTIEYDGNGGSGAPESQSKTEGVTIYLSTKEPTRKNYKFMGWATSAVSSTVVYTPGASFTKNENTKLYAVWEYYPETYTVYYDANGGDGAPDAQTKAYGVDLTLSDGVPVRLGYTFIGWSTSTDATEAEYIPEDIYTDNTELYLYAVWEKDNYEFSISELTVSKNELFQNEVISIKVRTDNWDENNGYADIPVAVYIDGTHISTQYIDFTAYGVANVTFSIDMGTVTGERTIEVRINWDKRNDETDSSNNSVSTTVNVKPDDYVLSIEGIAPNAQYKEGTTVISSFTVANESARDVIPSTGADAVFTAYYYNGSNKVEITTLTWNDVVIPMNGSNLIYFKWDVPAGLSGKTVYCECSINKDGSIKEYNLDDNTAVISLTVESVSSSQTENPDYSAKKPSDYTSVSVPSEVAGSASWTVWEYENGTFVQKKYGIKVSASAPVISPSINCKTAEFIGGKWIMKSGYGITLEYTPGIATLGGCNTPSESAYTGVQAAFATFPEYRYLDTYGKYRTLIYTDGAWRFAENAGADSSERVHFIPIWLDNGEYTVSVTADEVWTPAGKVSAVRNSAPISIDGTIYDDWYQS